MVNKLSNISHLNYYSVVFLCLLILLTGSCFTFLNAQNTSKDYRALVFQIVEEARINQGIKGFSMALVVDDLDPVLQGFGYSDVENQVHTLPSTIFPVSSLTGVITHMAILQLEKKGLIDLSKPVSHYLPAFSIKSRFENSRDITIDDLLNHYGGLPGELYKGKLCATTEGRPDIIEYLKSQYISFPPGKKYSYSTLGYEILGLVIVEVSGQSYAGYVQENILEPLGMRKSFFNYSEYDKNVLSKAYVYYDFDSREEFPTRLLASGGLYSNAHDMAKLLQWVLKPGNHDLNVSNALLDSMFTDQKPGDAIDISFRSSNNWVLEKNPEPLKGYFAYNINGSMHFSAIIAIAPEYDAGIVLLCNTAGVMPQIVELSRKILYNVISKKTGHPIIIESRPVHHSVIQPPRNIVSEIRGDYLLENQVLQVFEFNGEVILKSGDDAYKLFYNPDGWFTLNPSVRLKVDKHKDEKLLMIEQEGFVSPAGKDIRSLYRDSGMVSLMPGTYHLANVDPSREAVLYKKIELKQNAQVFMAEFFLSDNQRAIFGLESVSFNLIPTAEGNFTFAGFGRYQGETMFLSENEKGHYVNFSGLEFFKPANP